jgi:hypothetical protein
VYDRPEAGINPLIPFAGILATSTWAHARTMSNSIRIENPVAGNGWTSRQKAKKYVSNLRIALREPHVPADAPHDTTDAVGCWNGTRFVSWQEWLLSQPVLRVDDPANTEGMDTRRGGDG